MHADDYTYHTHVYVFFTGLKQDIPVRLLLSANSFSHYLQQVGKVDTHYLLFFTITFYEEVFYL